MKYMYRKKVRGQRRKLRTLLKDIDQIKPRFDYIGEYEHYHAPCGFWIMSKKTSGKIQTRFCRKWIAKTEELIRDKPETDKFCKIVAYLAPGFWGSQITIFYDEDYYNHFFVRNGPYQTWTKLEGCSFAKSRNIITSLKEQGYLEVLDERDDGEGIYQSRIWFYGELE